jgi:hypothetical protein
MQIEVFAILCDGLVTNDAADTENTSISKRWSAPVVVTYRALE